MEQVSVDEVFAGFVSRSGPQYAQVWTRPMLDAGFGLLKDFCERLKASGIVLVVASEEQALPPTNPSNPVQDVNVQNSDVLSGPDPFVDYYPEAPKQLQPKSTVNVSPPIPARRPANINELNEALANVQPTPNVDLATPKKESIFEKLKHMRPMKPTDKINPEE